MAERKVEFELVSPERLLVSQPVDMVVVPGVEGNFGVPPGHAPFISGVRMGTIDIYENGQIERRIFVAGGFAEVTAERCTVLAEQATPVEDLDRAALDSEIRHWEERLKDSTDETERTENARGLAIAKGKLAVLSA